MWCSFSLADRAPSSDSMSCRVLGVGKELDSRSVANLECVVDKRSRRAPLRPSKASMAVVGSNNAVTVDRGSKALLRTDGRKVEYERSVSSRRLFAVGSGYFGLESLYLLIGLTVSLLILPLVLPPLPPPPFMLLLLPICILACLMILAVMPSNVRDLTYM